MTDETNPPALADATDSSEQALERVLRRIQGKPGFPALSESVAALNQLTTSDDHTIDQLSATILKDIGLTNKILQIANSAAYRGAGGGISSVSRAVSVLGLGVLREIAVTVMLFDQMQDKILAREIKEAFLRAHLAGTLAREASKTFLSRASEEAYICAMFHSVGQILTQLYFERDAMEIADLIERENLSEDEASTRVLGLTFSAMGRGITREWAFPPAIVQSLRPLPPTPIEFPKTPDESLRMLSGFANEVCAIIAADDKKNRGQIVSSLRQRFAGAMTFSNAQLQLLIEKSFGDTREFAGALGVGLAQSPFVKKVGELLEADLDAVDADAAPLEFEETAASPAVTSIVDEAATVDAQSVLSDGIKNLSNAITGDFVLNDIFRTTLETMHQAMGFQRVLMCLKDARTGHMVARMGCGKEASLLTQKFRFPLDDTPNVFQLAIGKGLDIVIADIADPKIADKIPAWYRKTVSARTFAIMPLMIKGQPVAMIYCDQEQPGKIVISEHELSLMKTLRNQALLAIKQTLLGRA